MDLPLILNSQYHKVRTMSCLFHNISGSCQRFLILSRFYDIRYICIQFFQRLRLYHCLTAKYDCVKETGKMSALRLFLVFLLFSPVFPVASPVYLEELLSFLVSPQSFSLSWCPPGFSQLFSVLWCPLFLSPDLLKASPVIFEASYNFYCYVRCFHSCSKLPML